MHHTYTQPLLCLEAQRILQAAPATMRTQQTTCYQWRDTHKPVLLVYIMDASLVHSCQGEGNGCSAHCEHEAGSSHVEAGRKCAESKM